MGVQFYRVAKDSNFKEQVVPCSYEDYLKTTSEFAKTYMQDIKTYFALELIDNVKYYILYFFLR